MFSSDERKVVFSSDESFYLNKSKKVKTSEIRPHKNKLQKLEDAGVDQIM